jgi:3-phosphoshikimate 1-carboxyvinyltransferase
MAVTRFHPAGPLRGTITPPPDKSISHRVAIAAAMGEGETRVDGYLDAADTRSTLSAVASLGADIDELGPSRTPGAIGLRIAGVGLRGPGSARAGAAAIGAPGGGDGEALAIDVGNAGTLLRILPGWLAGQGAGEWTLDGDESVRRRPVDRIVEPLSWMGARVSCRDDRLPPLRVRGSLLIGIEYRLPVASAQVKSCLLVAGLLAQDATTIIESTPSRDHTERVLAAAGAEVSSEPLETPVTIHGALPARRVTVQPAARLELGDLAIPSDFSSAAFLIVASLLVSGSRVRLESVGINPTRIGLLGILTRMGAAIEVVETAAAGAEPRATITASHGPLKAARVSAGEVPLTIDELPLVALAGCFAEGETTVSGAEELRHKESDRIGTVVDGLRGLGAEIEATDDGFVVRGTGGLRGGTLDAAGDHRLAMLGAIAGFASREGVEVRGADAAAISYPGFVRDLEALVGRPKQGLSRQS